MFVQNRILLLIPVLILMLLFSSSGQAQQSANSTGFVIRVGTKPFIENQILNRLVYHALQDNGYRAFFYGEGTTFELRDQLSSGEIDVYVEYTGTGILHLNEQFPEQVPFEAGYDAIQAYNTVQAFDITNNGFMWLPPAPGNNTFGLAVKSEFAEENDIYTLSDLAEYARSGEQLVLSSSEEFCSRADGIQTIFQTYDFVIPQTDINCIEDGTSQETLAELQQGTNGTNVAMAFGTDAELLIGGVVFLEDDLNSQFVYQPAPVFRQAVIQENPDILSILQPIFQGLDNRTLQDLNLAVIELDKSPDQVALEYLVETGHIEDTEAVFTPQPVECEVERLDGAQEAANIRSEPQVAPNNIVGVLPQGVSLPVDGQRVGGDGYTWWRLTIRDGAWIREDTTEEIGDCSAVPGV